MKRYTGMLYVSSVGNKKISEFLAPRSYHGSLLLIIPRGFFCCLSLRYIVISWSMPLFKVWSEDKLNNKFIVAEKFAELVSKGIKAILFMFVTECCIRRVISQIHVFKASLSFGDRLCLRILFVG